MGTDRVVVNCACMGKPDLDTVDTIARMELATRRRGGRVTLYRAAAPLIELLDLAGLAGVLRVEVKRHPEEREELRRVEEERELGDPPVAEAQDL
ncbi:MAG TPA: hypothetical protein VHQ03_04160 [Candidatus Dormibacteraeota bacterium]|nr:hypothetical protein [Candidatus Dormibacteraeota bacterium]